MPDPETSPEAEPTGASPEGEPTGPSPEEGSPEGDSIQAQGKESTADEETESPEVFDIPGMNQSYFKYLLTQWYSLYQFGAPNKDEFRIAFAHPDIFPFRDDARVYRLEEKLKEMEREYWRKPKPDGGYERNPDYYKFVDKIKREVYHLPNSLFLSQKAFDRIMAQRDKYEFEFNCHESGNKNHITAFDKKTHSRVGDTIFTVQFLDDPKHPPIINEFSQFANQNFPGVGLLMVAELINYAKSKGVSHIRVSTRLLPKGLGNLGFKYVGTDNSPEGAAFEMVRYKITLNQPTERGDDH